MFVKGLTHDLLLEAGVFLVSVKLIMMSFKNNLYIQDLKKDLNEIKALLRHVEDNASRLEFPR